MCYNALNQGGAIVAYTVQVGSRVLYGYRGNIHMHTTRSDGVLTYEEIAMTAQAAGLDFVVITDHNAYEPELDGWHGNTLVLVGEEVYDPDREPPSSHALCFDISEDVARYGSNPQDLVDAVAARGGMTFLAHPFERDAGEFLPEPNISWRDWHVTGYTGIELWNYMSEFKAAVTSKARALLYAYAPELAISGPFSETLDKWDELLKSRPVPVLGGSDAHGTVYRLGPLSRAVQPHSYLFRCVNTHLVAEAPLTGDLVRDKRIIYGALAAGSGFLGYERIGEIAGFAFWARSGDREATMGERLGLDGLVELSAYAPAQARMRLIRDGTLVAQARGDRLTLVTRKAGVYRVEAYRRHAGRERGWLFSNPIYVRGPVQSQAKARQREEDLGARAVSAGIAEQSHVRRGQR